MPLRGNFVPDGAPVAASREIATKKQPYVFRKAVPWCTLFGTLPRANKAPLGLCCRSVRKATDTPCSRPRWRTRPQCPGKLQQKNTPLPPPSRTSHTIPRGLSRALKTPHWGVFAPRYAKRGARAVLVPDGAPVRNVPGNCNKKTPRNFLRGVCFGAPSGTRTQDPLIKSQLLSQVASSRGVENSVTQTDSGLYIYFYNLCLTVLENNIISDHLQLISPLSIGSVADYVYRAICFSNFLIKCCSCF